MTDPLPVLSVVVPVRNEGPNVGPLIAEIEAALDAIPHEIVYVDDGSTDATAHCLNQQRGVAPLVVRRHRSPCGQSAAILTGVRTARGTWIATLDGDGQNDPADIPALLAQAREAAGLVLIAGHRVTRRDTRTKRIASRLANRIRAGLLGDATPDTGCGLKVFRRDAFLALPHFDHMHRYLPGAVHPGRGAGGVRAGQPPAAHPGRVEFMERWTGLWVGIFDLAGVYWLQRRWKRPVVDLPE